MQPSNTMLSFVDVFTIIGLSTFDVCTSRTKKLIFSADFFGRFFGEKSVFGGAGKDFRVEKSSAKKSEKIIDFSAKNRKNPIFSRKKSYFSRNLG